MVLALLTDHSPLSSRLHTCLNSKKSKVAHFIQRVGLNEQRLQKVKSGTFHSKGWAK